MNPRLNYIDIHSHLNLSQFENDLGEVLSRMKKEKVGTIVIGVDKKTSEQALKLAKAHENIWACVGIHPTDSEDKFEEEFFEELIKNPKVIAIGECGLDYFHSPRMNADGGQAQMDADRERQRELFQRQIDFGVKHDLPLMLHVRDAHADVLEILKKNKEKYGDKLRGNAHFFTEDLEIAEKYFALGFTISLTGVITFEGNTADFDELVRNAPIEMLHAETDSPYAAPEPYRGKRNEPIYVKEVIKKIAEIREENEEEVRKKLLDNADRLFCLNLTK